MQTRKLGNSGIEVSALGLGCWAAGGPFWWDGKPVGWGQVDDAESIRAIRTAIDLGVNFFDTADVYGTGHSERILGRAVESMRENVIIATKFGLVFKDGSRQMLGFEADSEYIRNACDASLKRLNTDYIDLYQFHINEYDVEKARIVRDVLEELVDFGKIRSYGWSTDFPERAKIFVDGPNCVAFQHQQNMFLDNAEMIALCEQHNMASINRGPLAMGILTGKFNAQTQLPEDDIRHDWDFANGDFADQIKKLDDLKEILTSDGRTLPQAALGWLWARSPVTIPIPGFKSVLQVEDNVGALVYGPLKDEQMEQIAAIVSH